MEEKKKLLCSLISLVIILSMAVVLLPTVVEGSPATEIWDWYDLDAIRNNLDGDYILMNGLDSTTAGYAELAGPAANGGKGWKPIGTGIIDEELYIPLDPFTGNFDGQGYEIRDLFIDRPDGDCVGFFGVVEEGGIIENIGVVNAAVTGHRAVGGLVGTNGGAVTNCYSTGTMTGFTSVGGLMGANIMGIVSNSYSTGSVNGTEAVGGLVGFNDWGIVKNSYYDYDEVLINSENIITTGALFGADFEQWLANGKFLDVNERLSQEDGYYVINNVSDFKQLLAFGQDGSLKFRLKNNLDLDSDPNLYIPYLAGEFDGNGHKISNLSFNFDFVSQAQVGLFGYLASGGKITQVGVENVNISADFFVGGLVGDNRGTVSNSYATGRVTSEDVTGGLVGYNVGIVANSYSSGDPTSKYGYVGGLVGYNVGTVTNSYSSGNVTGNEYVGGLVGENDGTVSNSYSTGSVTGNNLTGGLVGQNGGSGVMSNTYSTTSVSGNISVGGLVGWNEGNVTTSYFTGNVTGNSYVGGLVGANLGTVRNSYTCGKVNGDDCVGGLVGDNYGTVSNSYSTGNVTGGSCVGGLVGGNNGTVDSSCATGSVDGSSSVGGLVGGNGGTVDSSYSIGNVTGSSCVSGLVGFNRGTVNNSYATGSVAGEDGIGGLVGYNEDGTVSNSYATGNVTGYAAVGGLMGWIYSGTVENCYSTGSVTGDEYVGGLVGYNEDGTVSNSFWDTETSEQTISAGGTGKMTVEMQDVATFLGAAWDIVAVANPDTRNPSYIWNIVDGETYPFLSWEQRTWYVDDDLVDYPDADFTEIQDAVDAASPGDIIIVYPGTYTENVNVNKDHLTIQSKNGANSTIVQAANPNDHIFMVTADYVEINGLTVTGATGACGICLDEANNDNISENNISDNEGGINLEYSSNNAMTNNNVNSNSGDGIRLSESSDNEIAGNNVWNNECGIDLEYSSDTVIMGNYVSNNHFGIHVELSSSNNTVTSNNVSNNEDGICLEDSSNNTLTNNTVSWNNNDGIVLLDSSNNNTITDNTANSNGWGGIRLGDGGDPSRDVTDNIVSGNTASNNGDDGIGLEWSEGNSVVNNTVASNGAEGISLYHSNNSVVANNTANNNGHNGVGLLDASNNILNNNIANSNDECGIYLTDSSNNTLRNNTMSGNPCNFFCFDEDELSHFIQDIDASNLVDGKSIYYWVNQHDSEIPNDAGFVALISCTNITVRNLTLTHNIAGVLLVSSTDSRIENVSVSNNYGGIGLLDSSNNIVSGSTCNNNDEVGIYVYQSNHNRITNNIIESSKGMDVVNSSHNVISHNSACSNAGDGIWLWNSTYNTISNNEASGNTVHNGISLGASYNNTLIDNVANANCDNGINLYDGSTNNQLIHNTLLENNAHGIAVDSSPGNVIMQNTVSSNNCGIGIYKSSSNNIIYLNSFNNDCNVCSDEQSTNMWDSPEEIAYTYNGNTYTSYLGNYWSDYTGNDADGDGIGDTPYSIDSDADNYPLMAAWESYFVVVSIDAPDEVTEGGDFVANVAVDYVENFNSCGFDVIYDQTIITVTDVTGGEIDGHTIGVRPGDWSFIPPGPDPGKIRVIAQTVGIPGSGVTGTGYIAQIHYHVLGSIGDTSNIHLENLAMYDYQAKKIPTATLDDTVTVTISCKLGDANMDGVVDTGDITKVKRIYFELDPPTPCADVNGDGLIDTGDITAIKVIYFS
ncbi:MAG: NosD domain-containing protein [Dehalococcoidia bacterium]